MSLFGGIELPGKPDPENVRRLGVMPVPMIRRMQRMGIAIDREWLWALSSRLEQRKAELSKDISSYIPRSDLDSFVGESGEELGEFNVESAPQIAELLFSKLKIGAGERLKTTKSGKRLSTGKKQLEGLKWRHPVIPLVLEYRECSKLKSTYADALPALAKAHNAGECGVCGLRHREAHYRVHTELPTTRTDTDRLASRRPNLQNCPTRTALGREVRKAFIATQGKRLLSVDYSQIELRLLADRARERNMIRIFKENLDIHADTAMRAFNIPLAEVLTSEGKLLYRAPCKNVNFGVCIASGQRVLTNHGLIPIEQVSISDLVWDGVEFVGHAGVVCRGIRRVITWDGLTATPDHMVWSQDGRKATLAENKQRERRLAVTGIEDDPIRFPSDYFDHDTSQDRVSDGVDRVRGMRTRGRGVSGQHTGWEDDRLPLRATEVRDCERNSSGRQVLLNPATMLKSDERQLEELRCQRDTESLQVSVGVCGLCDDSPAAQGLSQSGHRQDRQRWPLRTRQYSTGDAQSEPAKHKAQQEEQTAVYDIMNAGPRRRFTVEGKLASNCYGLSPSGLYDLMMITFATAGVAIPDWLTFEWCEEFIETWFNLYPDAAEYFELQHWRARRYGITWCMFGGVRRIPEVRSTHNKVIAAGLRQAGNNPIQRGAAGVFKIGMARVERRFEELRGSGIGCEALLPIHDELVSEVDEEWAEEVSEMVGAEMAKSLVDEESGELRCRVPVLTEAKIMERWAK